MYDGVEGRTEAGSLLIEHDSAKGEILLRSKRPLRVKGGEKSRPVRFYYRAEGASSGTIMQLFFEDEYGERYMSAPSIRRSVSYTASSQTMVRNTAEGIWHKRLAAIPESKEDKDYTLVISIRGNPASIWIDDFSAPASEYGYWWPAGTISLEENWEEALDVAPEVSSAQVVKVGNQPRLLINGEAVPPIMYLTQRSNMGDYAGAEQIGGVRIIVPSIPMSDLHDPRFEPRPPVWRGGVDFDFETILKDIDRAANDARESYLILNLCFYWPADWAENNPEEVWMDIDGNWGYGTQLYFEGFGKELPPASNYRWWPSPSSQKALADAAVGIRELVEALREKPYFNRIIGCHISGGHDQQMFTGHWLDYSKPAQRALRQWLRERYGNDNGLQKAWNDSSVTLETVKIPDYRKLREKKSGGAFFLNPLEDQRFADLLEFQAERGMIIRQTLAEVFREAMEHDVVTMTWQIGGGRGQGTEKLFLNSPALDMMVTQPTYSVRLPGMPGGLRSMLGSLAYHGKLSIMELDLRTWLRTGGDELHAINLGAGLTPDMFRSIIRREAAQMMSRGHGFWLYDIVPIHYRDPVIYEEVAEVVRAYKELVIEDENPFQADVAVAWSDHPDYWLSDGTSGMSIFSRPDFYTPPHLREAGMQYDMLFLGDLLKIQQEEARYKLVVIMDCLRLTDEERARVREVLQRNGTTVVWGYGTGYLSDNGYSVEAMRDLSGIEVTEAVTPEFISTHFVEKSDDPLLDGLDGFAGLGEVGMAVHSQRIRTNKMSSNFVRFVVADDDATPLAEYDDGQTAIAINRFDDWSSVVLGMPGVLDARLINRLAREAGATVLTDAGNVVDFGGKFLSVHAMSNEPIEINLPYPATVKDFHSGKLITTNQRSFTINVPAGETRWYEVSRNQK